MLTEKILSDKIPSNKIPNDKINVCAALDACIHQTNVKDCLSSIVTIDDLRLQAGMLSCITHCMDLSSHCLACLLQNLGCPIYDPILSYFIVSQEKLCQNIDDLLQHVSISDGLLRSLQGSDFSIKDTDWPDYIWKELSDRALHSDIASDVASASTASDASSDGYSGLDILARALVSDGLKRL